MIRRSVIVLLCCFAVLIAAATELSAQEGKKAFASKGTVEVGGSLSFSSTWEVVGGETIGTDPLITFTAEPYVGYFVIDGLEVGANPLGVTVLSSGSTTVTALDMYGSVAYNFKTPTKIYPYLEGLAGYTMVTSSGSTIGGFSWGGRGGIKVAVTPGALLNIGAEYRLVNLSPSGASGRYGYNRLAAVAGFSIWF